MPAVRSVDSFVRFCFSRSFVSVTSFFNPPTRLFKRHSSVLLVFEIYHVTLLSSSSYNRANLRWMKKTVQWMKLIPAFSVQFVTHLWCAMGWGGTYPQLIYHCSLPSAFCASQTIMSEFVKGGGGSHSIMCIFFFNLIILFFCFFFPSSSLYESHPI
jgi:hypothetical protein